MIHICFFGKITEIKGTKAVIRVAESEDEVVVELGGNQSLELVNGDEGIFSGHIENKKVFVTKINLRKLVDPLYQEDLLRKGALLDVTGLIHNPFPKIYKDYLQYEEYKQQVKEESK